MVDTIGKFNKLAWLSKRWNASEDEILQMATSGEIGIWIWYAGEIEYRETGQKISIREHLQLPLCDVEGLLAHNKLFIDGLLLLDRSGKELGVGRVKVSPSPYHDGSITITNTKHPLKESNRRILHFP